MVGLPFRPGFGPGARDPRLVPQFRSQRDPDKKGPLVRETSQSGCIYPEYKGYRRAIGLPDRFDRKD